MLALLGVILSPFSMVFVLQQAYAHTCEEDGCIEEGRMTGGGRINSNVKLTHGFELHCNPDERPNNLEINWGKGNKYHLESVTDINCFNDHHMIQASL